MEKLVVLAGPDLGREIRLSGYSTTIGRGAENRIVLQDPYVSRRHFLLRRSSGELWLEDLGARNAVVLNGVPTREARLRSGDRILVGETELLITHTGPFSGPRTDPQASTLDVGAAELGECPDPFARLLGACTPLRETIELLRRAAATKAPVLILGETGTGKELAAEALHRASACADGPFIQVNAAGIPESLAESELFGHEKGAFTGAVARRRGQLELADGGTFFLDEVGELSVPLQAKLLRAFENRTFRPVGGAEDVTVDARIVAATNRDLAREVEQSRFRADLYYRLNVFTVTMPPLRERREDIPLLARHFAVHAAYECGRATPVLTDEALAWLDQHPWPGNVRELKNAVLRAVLRADSDRLTPRAFQDPHQRGAIRVGGGAPPVGLRSLREAEQEEIERVLTYTRGNKTRAAQILGISRNTLYEKLRLYGGEGCRPGGAPGDRRG